MLASHPVVDYASPPLPDVTKIVIVLQEVVADVRSPGFTCDAIHGVEHLSSTVLAATANTDHVPVAHEANVPVRPVPHAFDDTFL